MCVILLLGLSVGRGVLIALLDPDRLFSVDRYGSSVVMCSVNKTNDKNECLHERATMVSICYRMPLLAHASHHLLITFCVLEFAVNQAAAGYGNTGLLTVMFLYCVAEGERAHRYDTQVHSLQAVIFTRACYLAWG
jgi:hypothetical protein